MWCVMMDYMSKPRWQTSIKLQGTQVIDEGGSGGESKMQESIMEVSKKRCLPRDKKRKKERKRSDLLWFSIVHYRLLLRITSSSREH